jgi:hypothetical protein
MPTQFDDIIGAVSSEDQHMTAINTCFIYFAELAETRRRGAVSNLFECLPADLPKDCDDARAARLHKVITEFIEKCPSHPNVISAFRTLLLLSVMDLTGYFVDKLRFYHSQGNAYAVFQLCTVLEDLGLDVFRDEKGERMASRSSCEAEMNLGVARRFLKRHDA